MAWWWVPPTHDGLLLNTAFQPIVSSLSSSYLPPLYKTLFRPCCLLSSPPLATVFRPTTFLEPGSPPGTLTRKKAPSYTHLKNRYFRFPVPTTPHRKPIAPTPAPTRETLTRIASKSTWLIRNVSGDAWYQTGSRHGDPAWENKSTWRTWGTRWTGIRQRTGS